MPGRPTELASRGVPSSIWLVIAILAAAVWPPIAGVIVLFSWSSEESVPGSIERMGAVTLAAIPGLLVRALVEMPVTTPSSHYFGELSSFTLLMGRVLLWVGVPLVGMVLVAWWLRDSSRRAVAIRTRFAALAGLPVLVGATVWGAAFTRNQPAVDSYVSELPELGRESGITATETAPGAKDAVLASCDGGELKPLYQPEVTNGDPGLCVRVGPDRAVLVDAFQTPGGWTLRKDEAIGLWVLHRGKSTNRGFAIDEAGTIFELRKAAILDRVRPSDATLAAGVLASVAASLLLLAASRARRRASVLEKASTGTLNADGTLEVGDAGPRPVEGATGIMAGPVTVLSATLEAPSYRAAGRAQAKILGGAREDHLRATWERANAATSAALALVVLLGVPLVTHAVGAALAPWVRSRVEATPMPSWPRRKAPEPVQSASFDRR